MSHGYWVWDKKENTCVCVGGGIIIIDLKIETRSQISLAMELDDASHELANVEKPELLV